WLTPGVQFVAVSPGPGDNPKITLPSRERNTKHRAIQHSFRCAVPRYFRVDVKCPLVDIRRPVGIRSLSMRSRRDSPHREAPPNSRQPQEKAENPGPERAQVNVLRMPAATSLLG